ncbi:MAG: energy-coupling factor transporter transmembrane component T [Thermoprotei archaeon]
MTLLSTLLVNVLSWLFVLFGYSAPLIVIFGAIGLTGFMEITRFEKGTTFYYRLNPVTKIVLGLVVTTISAIAIWWIGAIVTLILAFSYLTLVNGRRKLALGVLLIFITVIGAVQSFAPYTPFSVLTIAMNTTHFQTIWTWPGYFNILGFQKVLTVQAIIYGLQISMRFTAVLLAALILVLTSTPSEILRALNKVGIPISITFALIVAMRTIPRIFDALDLSVKAQLMRGLGVSSNRFMRAIYYAVALFASIVPVMIFLLRGAKNTAISADTRAFRAYNKRTYMNPILFTKLDWYTFGIMALALGLTVLAVMLGFGRTILYAGA